MGRVRRRRRLALTDERRIVLGLVAAQVRVRFALDAARFAERLLDRAREAVPPSDRPLGEHVRRLSLDDLYLATACAEGDERAWEELTRRHGGFMRAFALRFLREPDASDVADQVVADLWQRRKIAQFQGRSTLRTWLAAVVARAALNAGKARRRVTSLEGEGGIAERPTPAVEPGEDEAEGLLARLVAQAIEGLPAAEKLLLRLYYEQEMTLDQMAVALRASKATLSRRLARTRSALRASIESLARCQAGASADALRAGVDLGRLELDLGRLVGRGRKKSEEALSQSRGPLRLGRDGARG